MINAAQIHNFGIETFKYMNQIRDDSGLGNLVEIGPKAIWPRSARVTHLGLAVRTSSRQKEETKLWPIGHSIVMVEGL
jgi:hypothetical protein